METPQSINKVGLLMFVPAAKHLEACKRLRILVVGDVMLDHYLRGRVERTSPEAPVPVLRVDSEDYILGGAANVAHNISAMGAKVDLAGVIGRDSIAAKLLSLLRDAVINPSGLTPVGDRPTTLKTRALAQGQQVLRIDHERVQPIAPSIEKKLLNRLRRSLDSCHGVILSDYGKGTLTSHLIQWLVKECARLKKPIISDPKGLEYWRYQGIDVITPNVKEAQAASGIEITDECSLERAAAELNRQVQGKAICITRGAHGVGVFPRRGKSVLIPAQAREVYDVTGAGDTFIAHFALAYFQGLSLEEAAAWGNLAAGIVVGRLGVAAVHPGELLSEATGDRGESKVKTLTELEPLVRSLQSQGRRVVFTNGCFDLLHVGHIRFLESARTLGACLIVAINSDESVRAVKGPPRPLLPESERAALLASLISVDHVLVFQERTPEHILRRLRPDILVKGGTFEPDEVVGREIVERYGGEVRVLPLFGERSVSQLLETWGAASNARSEQHPDGRSGAGRRRTVKHPAAKPPVAPASSPGSRGSSNKKTGASH